MAGFFLPLLGTDSKILSLCKINGPHNSIECWEFSAMMQAQYLTPGNFISYIIFPIENVLINISQEEFQNKSGLKMIGNCVRYLEILFVCWNFLFLALECEWYITLYIKDQGEQVVAKGC